MCNLHLPEKGSLAALFSIVFICWTLETGAEASRISDKNLDIQIGQAIFEKLWVFAPSSTRSSDGLGPLYNARSCAQCHTPSQSVSDQVPVSLVMMLSIQANHDAPLSAQDRQDLLQNGFISEPVYGKQIQTFAYPGAPAEARIKRTDRITTLYFPDQQQVQIHYPEYQLVSAAYGPFHKDIRISPRIAPRLQGLGILESVPEEQITALEDPDDLNGDGISGRANRVYDPLSEAQRIGRFGWKAAKASLEHQNLAALVNDIGVSSWLFQVPAGDCSSAQTECLSLADSTLTTLHRGGTDHDKLKADLVEASREMTDLLYAYTREIGNASLYRPQRPSARQLKGKQFFTKSGCLDCHSDKLSNSSQLNEGQNIISPYSDLLLHDMGEGLADNRTEFQANGREWRTAPLWGIAYYLRHTEKPLFLHDGRAASIEEAIFWHGGEAESSKQRFMAMPEAQRTQLIHFVESL